MLFDKERRGTYYIQTFGCQMNERDSETIAGILEEKGFLPAEQREDADVIVINTCSVRENADNRFFGQLGVVKKIRERNPGAIVAVCGCMMQQKRVTDRIRDKYNWVDIIFGTMNIDEFPKMLEARMKENRREYHIVDAREQIAAAWYAEGIEKRDAQDWNGARTAFENAGDYNHAAEEITETTYREASALKETGDRDNALKLFEGLGAYADSAQKVRELWYTAGLEKQASADWDEAVEAFMRAGDYGDALTQITATRFMEGEIKQAAQDWDGAIEAYQAAEQNEEVQRRIEECLYQETIRLYEDIQTQGASVQPAIDAMTAISDPELFRKARDVLRKGDAFHEAWSTAFRTGETICFGRYEQDNNLNNGPEPISWIVLYAENGEALLLSEKVIDAMAFIKGIQRTDISGLDADEVWQRTEIRQWISDTFRSAFTEQEASLFVEQDGSDSIFILDNREYRQYCSKEDPGSVQATAYALSKDEAHHDLLNYHKDETGTWIHGDYVMWWIRTGAIKEENYLYPYRLDTVAGVRPAIRIQYDKGPTDEWIDSEYSVRPEATKP